MKVYVATQKQENARPVRDAIVAAGHTCTATWIDLKGYASVPGDFLARREAALTCEREVEAADVLVLVAEPDGERVRGGKHVETGMALAQRKRVFVLGNRENVFHWHPLVKQVDTLGELVNILGRVDERGNICSVNCGCTLGECPFPL